MIVKPYVLTNPARESGKRKLASTETLENAQKIGEKFGEGTLISLYEDEKVKRAWVLGDGWKEKN